MLIQELVGRRLAEARNDAGLTQAVLGMKVAKYLGGGWSSKHAVSRAENGHRPLTAEHVFVFAMVLGRPIRFFVEPRDGETVELRYPSSLGELAKCYEGPG